MEMSGLIPVKAKRGILPSRAAQNMWLSREHTEMRHRSQQLAGAPDLFITVLVQDLINFYSGGKAQNANMKCDMP